jgi:glycine oxidase
VLSQTRISALRSDSADVAIVGGGVIGLAVAWRAALAGMSVTVLERDTLGAGASHVAAGMLAPVAEVEFGQAGQNVLELGLHSAALWPAFVAELREVTGIDVGLRQTGTLMVARDQDEARELERQIAYRDSLGLSTKRLLPSAARELEPALAPVLRLALEAPDDHSVDPRLVLAALTRACQIAGVRLREQCPVAGVELDSANRRVTGLKLPDGEFISASGVVLAAGAWTAELDGLPEHARVPVRPLKGQILRLRDPAGPGLLQHVVRFQGGYLVPRGDGRYVLGATMEERGFEVHPTAGGVYELLRDAYEMVPGVAELAIEELGVGLRPSTPDNMPAIGLGELGGLVWAAGHHRNGILLAPLTAMLVAGVLAGSTAVGTLPASGFSTGGLSTGGMTEREPSKIVFLDRELLSRCDPRRFADTHVLPTTDPTRPPLGVPS